MKGNRNLIECALPLDALARAAANEARAGTGAPSSLHLWWGNRQLAIARGLIFAQLVDAPPSGDRERTEAVNRILEGLLDGDPLAEPKARALIAESCGGDRPTVYDPFCGVGTVPFAALTLGIPAFGVELNPVAAFIARVATGAYLSDLEEIDLSRAIRTIDVELKRQLCASYPGIKVTAAMAKGRPDMRNYVGRTLPIEMWLWARTVPDPNPAFGGCPVPLVTNFVTGAKKGRESWLEIEPLKTRKNYRIVVHSGEAPKHAEKGNRQGRADFFSPFDHRPITADHIREQGKRGKLGVRLMALFATGDNGEKVVLPPTREQERIATAIDTDLPVMPFSGNVRDCAACGFGYATYGELFLPRQRQMLKRLGELINAYARRGVKERLAANVLAVGLCEQCR